MSESLLSILDEIIRVGQQQGLNQAEICQKAGVSVITLSRAKKQADIRFSTLEKLANSVGLCLTLSADHSLVRIIEKGDLFS